MAKRKAKSETQEQADAEELFIDSQRTDTDDYDYEDEDDDEEERPSRSEKRSKRRDDDDDDLLELGGEVFEPPHARAPVGIVGGTLQVILTAIIALILFLLVGFGVVFGGRLAGVIEPSIPQASSSGFVRPTAVAMATDVPVEGCGDPGAAVDPRCDLAGEWWSAVSPQYNVIAGQFGSLYATPPDQRVISRDAVQAAQSAIGNVQPSPCLARAHQSLIGAARTAFDVTTQIAAGDTSTYASGRSTLEVAFTEMYVAAWSDANFATDPDSPPALGVVRLGGVDCTGQTQGWYDSIRPQLQVFDGLLATEPIVTRLRTLESDMNATIGTIQQSTPPECATTARDILIASLQGYVEGNRLIGLGDMPGARAAFGAAARAEFKFNAWMSWLGVIAL